jgi:ankyrin repeat protein
MHLAVMRGDAELVRRLADAGGDVNLADDLGRTPLHFARAPDVIALLSELGCEPNAVDSMGDTPLSRALSTVDPKCTVECVRALVEAGAGPNRRVRGEFPLAIAVRLERSDLVDVLLGLDIDVQARAENGRTILHEVIRSPKDWDIRAFVRRGADPSAQDDNGVSPLHLAVAAGLAENARTLVKVGADVNAADSTGRTPLHLAVAVCVEGGVLPSVRDSFSGIPLHCTVGMAGVLIDQGADVNATDNAGLSPLDLAMAMRVRSGVPVPGAEEAQRRVISLLVAAGAGRELRSLSKVVDRAMQRDWPEALAAALKAGVSANRRNGKGQTLLEIAAVQGQLECIKVLVAGGAEVDGVGSRGRTALIHVLDFWWNSGSVVCALLDAGANPNVRDPEGNPALHKAVARGQLDLVRRLLACSSIDVSAVDARGRTALHRAAEFGCVEIMDVLVEAGVPLDAVGADGGTALGLGSRDVVAALLPSGQKAAADAEPVISVNPSTALRGGGGPDAAGDTGTAMGQRATASAPGFNFGASRAGLRRPFGEVTALGRAGVYPNAKGGAGESPSDGAMRPKAGPSTVDAQPACGDGGTAERRVTSASTAEDMGAEKGHVPECAGQSEGVSGLPPTPEFTSRPPFNWGATQQPRGWAKCATPALSAAGLIWNENAGRGWMEAPRSGGWPS